MSQTFSAGSPRPVSLQKDEVLFLLSLGSEMRSYGTVGMKKALPSWRWRDMAVKSDPRGWEGLEMGL